MPSKSATNHAPSLRSRHSKKSASAKRAARNTQKPADESTDSSQPSPSPVTLPAPRTPSESRASQNLLDALGGPDQVIPRLRSAGDKKADRLADLMMAKDFDAASFHFKIKESGWNLRDFMQAMLDVNSAAAVARLAAHSEQVAEAIIERAVDRPVRHSACLGTGRVLKDTEAGQVVTNEECFACAGSGWVVKEADGEWVDRHLKITGLLTSAPLVSLTKNVTNQNLNVYGDLKTGDGAPEIDSIIKRADEQILIPETKRLTDGSERLPDPMMQTMTTEMPEDEVEEAEVVSEASGIV